MKVVWILLKETFGEWWDDNASLLSAAVAFYTIFSIAPLLLIAIAVASILFGGLAVHSEVMYWTQDFAGPAGAAVVESILDQAKEKSSLATVVGIATSLFGATGVFMALQDSLNRMWDVAVKPGQTVKMFLLKRLESFVLVLLSGALLLASLIANTVLTAAEVFFQDRFPVPPEFVSLAQFLISFALVTTLFASLYKILPDAKISWADVWFGAAVTSLLFSAGKSLISLYLAKSTIASPYGAAGSLVLVLAWIYYSVQIFFLGAEFTQVNAKRRGSPIEPDRHAVRLVTSYRFEPS